MKCEDPKMDYFATTQGAQLCIHDKALRLYAGDATHQHYKGGLYKLMGSLYDADTRYEIGVLYEHCYPYSRQFWTRSEEEWKGCVACPSREARALWFELYGTTGPVKRFRRLGEEWEAGL